jgi:hypothetical protein
MADAWQDATWADVVVGDFVRVKGQICRVDHWDDEQDGGARVAVALYRPDGTQRGFFAADKPVELRTRKDGKLTAAGRRFDGLSAAGARALREQLGAEMVATQDAGGRRFAPWVCVRRYGTVRQLADHLSLFHQLHTGDVKPSDGPGLRRAHEEFHAAAAGSALGLREPHIHNDEAFEREP